jgi:hypothetical protein
MITGAKLITGLKSAPFAVGPQTLISVNGPGVFVSGIVVKQEGSGDSTRITVKIDGQTLFDQTFAGADNAGYDTTNNSGFYITRGADDVLSFSFSEPLHFLTKFLLEINVNNETGVSQIIGRCVMGSGCSYPN